MFSTNNTPVYRALHPGPAGRPAWPGGYGYGSSRLPVGHGTVTGIHDPEGAAAQRNHP